jgi:hypothetical protein
VLIHDANFNIRAFLAAEFRAYNEDVGTTGRERWVRAASGGDLSQPEVLIRLNIGPVAQLLEQGTHNLGQGIFAEIQ